MAPNFGQNTNQSAKNNAKKSRKMLIFSSVALLCQRDLPSQKLILLRFQLILIMIITPRHRVNFAEGKTKLHGEKLLKPYTLSRTISTHVQVLKRKKLLTVNVVQYWTYTDVNVYAFKGPINLLLLLLLLTTINQSIYYSNTYRPGAQRTRSKYERGFKLRT